MEAGVGCARRVAGGARRSVRSSDRRGGRQTQRQGTTRGTKEEPEQLSEEKSRDVRAHGKNHLQPSHVGIVMTAITGDESERVMSEVQGTLEFSVELHKFHNVDLFQRG
ncbi:Protein FAM135B [Liparis tanakae]|uniref:Protein FAM135B n=1 Tax=Liparis tanakae TaxID=230148 RepID=A0A4Z2HMW8_9TELE|nr:Protein FAM135B [Liparis tanakae]